MVLLEHIDWSTGRKEANNFTHMKNWLYQLSTKYNLAEDAMKNAIQAGCSRGWFDLTDQGRILSLGEKPVPSLIEEVTAPVEPEVKTEEGELPYHKREGWVALTRERIRELTACPKCGAERGFMCKGEKRGLNNREANHKERSQTASRVAKKEFDERP